MATILHVDMDAFYAAVEQLDHPEYRNKPLIIGGTKDSVRGVVSTCSYEARKYGVRSAMPIKRAVAFAPMASLFPAAWPDTRGIKANSCCLSRLFTGSGVSFHR